VSTQYGYPWTIVTGERRPTLLTAYTVSRCVYAAGGNCTLPHGDTCEGHVGGDGSCFVGIRLSSVDMPALKVDDVPRLATSATSATSARPSTVPSSTPGASPGRLQ
jgi:hypothetical protein